MSGLDRTADALLSQKAAQTAAYEELQSTFGHNSRKIRSLMVSLSMTQEDIDRLGAQKETIVSSDARLTKRLQEIKDRHVAQTHVTNQCTDTTVSVSKTTKDVVAGWEGILPGIANSKHSLDLQDTLDTLEDDVDAKFNSLHRVVGYLRNMSRLADGSRILFVPLTVEGKDTPPFDAIAHFQKWEETSSSSSSRAEEEGGVTSTTTSITSQHQQDLINDLPCIKALLSIEMGNNVRQCAAETKIADVKSKMEELAARKADLMARYDNARISFEARIKIRNDLEVSVSSKKQTNQEALAVNNALKASILAKEASLSLGASEREKRMDELAALKGEGAEKLSAATETMSIAVASHERAEAERQACLRSLSELEVSRAVWTRRLAQDRRLRSLRHHETEKQHAVVTDALKTVSQKIKERFDAESEWKKAQQATTDTKAKIASTNDIFMRQDFINLQMLSNLFDEENNSRNHIELEFNDIATFKKYWFDRIMEEVICCQIREYVTTISLEELAFSTIVEAHTNELDDLISRMAIAQAAAAADKLKRDEAAQRALTLEAPSATKTTAAPPAKKPTFIVRTVAEEYSDSEDGGISLGRDFHSLESGRDRAPPQRQLGSSGGVGGSQKNPLTSSLLTSQASLLTSQRPSILFSRAGQHAATLPTTPTVANQKSLQSANPAVLTTPSSQQRIRHSFLPPVPKFAAAAAQSSSSATSMAVPSSSGGNVGRAPLTAANIANISGGDNVLAPPRRPALGKKRAVSPAASFDSFSSILRPKTRKNRVELSAFEHQMLFGIAEDYDNEEDAKILQLVGIKEEVRPPPNSYKAPPTPLPGTVEAKHKKVLDEIAREHSVCNIPTEAVTGSKSPSPRRPTITNKSHPMLMAVAQVVKNMTAPATGRGMNMTAPTTNKIINSTTTTAAVAANSSGGSRFHLSTTNNGTPKRAPHAAMSAATYISPSSITTPRRQLTATDITPQHNNTHNKIITNGGSDKRGGGGHSNTNNAADFGPLSPLSNTSHNNALVATSSGGIHSKKSAAVAQPPPASPGLSFTQRMLGGARKQAAAVDSQQVDHSGGRSSMLLRSQAVNTAVTTSSTRGGGVKAGTGRRSGIIAPQDENDEFAL